MSNLQHKDHAGRIWRKYTCSFKSPDGTYAFDLWAISDDHAQLQMDALKETAVVNGRVEGEIPWGAQNGA